MILTLNFKFERRRMMRKLLILILLMLGMASTSQAALVWFEVDSGSTVAAGETITINLVSDTACNGWSINAVAEVDGSGNQTMVAYPGLVSNLSNGNVLQQGIIDNYQGALFGGQSGSFGSDESGPMAAGQPIMSFAYTISSDWDGSAIMIAPLQAGKTYTYGDGQSYTAETSYADLGTDGPIEITGTILTPEPTTIALLGLGCMMLVRKKRA
jgi:hypothetical protein